MLTGCSWDLDLDRDFDIDRPSYSARLSFEDHSTGAEGVQRAVQTGSETQIRVGCRGCDDAVLVSSAQSESPDVLEVIDVGENRFQIRGISAGDAVVRVVVNEGMVGEVTLRVRDAEYSTLRISPWGDSKPLPRSLWEDGFAVLEGSEFEVRAFPKDIMGERLSGYNGVTWQVISDAFDESILSFAPNRADESARIDIPPGTAGSRFLLRLNTGEEQLIEVVSESDVARLELVSLEEAGPRVVHAGERYELNAARMHLVGRTEAGAYVSGPGERYATVSIESAIESQVHDIAYQLNPIFGPDTSLDFYTDGRFDGDDDCNDDPDDCDYYCDCAPNSLLGCDSPADDWDDRNYRDYCAEHCDGDDICERKRHYFERAFLLVGVADEPTEGTAEFAWAGHRMTVQIAFGE